MRSEWADYWASKNYPGILAEFIEAGDLVFDIGANIGKMSYAYRLLNANVIAVEPQASCVEHLKAAFVDDANVEIVHAACGASPGQAELSIYGGTTISTLVPEHYWCDGGPWQNTPKDGSEMVKLITLDKLIDLYGIPSFIKIDVEGYELEVLHGLSQFVPLQFEYHPFFARQACQCMARILEIEPDAEFGRTPGERLQLDAGWVGYDQMRSQINALYQMHGKNYFGNIYARKAT